MTDSLPAMGGAEQLDDRRRRALDRLRRSGRPPGSSPASPVGDPAPSVHGPARDVTSSAICAESAADRLAVTLGGRTEGTGSSAYAVIETEVTMPLDPAALGELPEPIDPAAPLLCLDTETTGLGTGTGTVAFLVGLGRWRGDRFRVTQLVLPDHPAEPALLERIAAELASAGTLVTYNGRQFDWPLLVTRRRLHGRPLPPPTRHLDLLPLARAIWRHRLPDARLASVEHGIAGVRRGHDLPGAEVPARYFDWLRCGDPSLLVDVLRHNLQDIVSLGLLLRVLTEELLPARSGAVPPSVVPADLAGLARSYARRGDAAGALRCLDAALGATPARPAPADAGRSIVERMLADRARILTRLGRHEEAATAWEAIALEGGPLATLAWIQVAKDREHRQRDPRGALVAAHRARAIAERARFVGDPDRLAERDLPRRLARLQSIAARTVTVRGTPAG